jgi:hypothetical protein
MYYAQLINYPFSGECWFYDFTARLHLNDVYLHLSHFYWTTLTYLGPFFVIQLTLAALYFTPHCLSIVVTLLFVYITEVSDFLTSNYLIGISTLNYWDFNNLLTNNLNKYHPHIFYVSTILCILISTFESLYAASTKWSFSTPYLAALLKNLMYLAGLINVFALFLGSWWAFQEGTWGGWWNWDPSEVLGLIVFVISLVGLHHFTSNPQSLTLIIKLKLGVSLLVLAYFFTQLNFDLVSHNFGNRFTFFFTNTLFYLESASLAGAGVLLGLFSFTKKIVCLRLLHSESYLTPSRLLISSALTFIWIWLLLTSFLPLCNYFFWQYFHLNLFNTSVSHQGTLFYLVLGTYLVFGQISYFSHSIVVPLICLWLPTYLLIPLLCLSSATQNMLFFHASILMQLASNLVTNQLDNLSDLSSNINTPITIGGVVNHSMSSVYVCEDVWRETFYLRFSAKTTPYSSYTLSTESNIHETNVFTLVQDSNSFINYYQITCSYIESIVAIWNPYFVNVYEATLVTIVIFVAGTHTRSNLHL